MVDLNLARLCLAVKPTVDGREGDAEFLGKLFLGDAAFEAVSFELLNDVHDGLHFIASS